MQTIQVSTTTDERIRAARRELKQAERALARAERGSVGAVVALERRDAAAVRFIALTSHALCRGQDRETPEAHAAHTLS